MEQWLLFALGQPGLVGPDAFWLAYGFPEFAAG
jgi:hypothetical protein